MRTRVVVESAAMCSRERSEPRRRRRGGELEQAILDAALVELAENGFVGTTVDGVARRAGTSKAVIYRRWGDKTELVLAAVTSVVPGVDDRGATGDLRGELIELIKRMVEGLDGPVGFALETTLAEAHRHPPLLEALRRRVAEPRRAAIRRVLERAVVRGEIDASAITVVALDVAPALITLRKIVDGHVSSGIAEEIVDGVLLPLLRTIHPADRSRKK